MLDKRATHEGSIRQRKDGSWEARIQIAGKRHSRYGATRADVVEKLHKLQASPVLMSPNPSISLDEWMTQWLAERDLRPSTLATYTKLFAPLRRDIGHVKLTKLNPMMLSLTFSLLRERGMGPRRVQLAHGYLKSCLGRAVEMGLLPSNPMSVVRRPKWTAATKRYWTLEESQRFMDTCLSSPLRYAPLFLLLVATGLRISEALALEEGIPTLVVDSAAVWEQNSGYTTGATKTATSRRTVSVPEVAYAALPSIPFRTQSGKIPRPAMLRSTLTALCAQAKVPPVTPHGLRHIHAALAYSATGDAYAVQKRLGHANVTTTMGMYGFGMQPEDATRAALDDLFASTNPPPHTQPEQPS